MLRRAPTGGFTLVEVMVAIVVLSLGLLGALTAFSIASRVTSASRNDTSLALLAQQKLAEIRLLEREELTSGTTTGDFGPDYVEHYWQLTVHEPDELNVVWVDVVIYAPEAGRTREVRLSTAIF